MTAAGLLNDPLREIRLYGEMGRRFGRVHRLAVHSVREAMQALCAVVPGFERWMIDHGQDRFHVFVGKRARGYDIGEEKLDLPVSAADPICVVPVVDGGKKQGAFQTIIGAVLVVVGAYFGQGWMVNIGYSMMASGVAQMLGARGAKKQETVENKPSYGYDGPVNTIDEGLPVPLALGRVLCGGARISAGISVDELSSTIATTGMTPLTLPADEAQKPGNRGWQSWGG